MALEDVLARVPGLAGYLAKQQYDQQANQSALGQMLGVANFAEQQKQNVLRAEAVRQEMAQRQQDIDLKRNADARRQTAIEGIGRGFDLIWPGIKTQQLGERNAADQPMGETTVASDPRAELAKHAAALDPNSAATLAAQAMGLVGARGSGAGAAPMLSKILADAEAARARGDMQSYSLLMANAERLAAGFNQMQLGNYYGQNFNQAQRNADLADRGVGGLPAPGQRPLPALPGSQPVPGVPAGPVQAPLTQGGMRTDMQNSPPTAPLPGNDQRAVLLQDEANRARARGDVNEAAQIESEIAKTAASATNVSSAATSPKEERERETARVKQMFELNSKQYQDFRSKRVELSSAVRALDRLSKLSEQGQSFTNAGAEFKMMLSSLAQAVGIPLNKEKLASSEEYQAQVAELLKARLGSKDYGSGTAVSNLDLIAAEQPLPGLVKSAAGQKQIIQALAQDAKERFADINAYSSWFERNRGNMEGFVFPSDALSTERIKKMQDIDSVRGGSKQELTREQKIQFYLRKHGNPP